jgi:hypothetical protein
MVKAKDSKLIGYCRVSTVPQTVQLENYARHLYQRCTPSRLESERLG